MAIFLFSLESSGLEAGLHFGGRASTWVTTDSLTSVGLRSILAPEDENGACCCVSVTWPIMENCWLAPLIRGCVLTASEEK